MIAIALLTPVLFLSAPNAAAVALVPSHQDQVATSPPIQSLAPGTARVRHRLPALQKSVPVLSTREVCGITRSSAMTGGSVTSDGGAAVTDRGVCWSTAPTPTIVDSTTTDGTGTGSFTSLVTGLAAGTAYTVRAFATNAVGTGYGSPITFTAATGYAGQTPPGLTPEMFAPGLVSTTGNQAGVAVHPGGREIYFVVIENIAGRFSCAIRVTRLEGCSWTTPVVAPFSGTHADMYLAMHPDGSRMYFQSDRPIDHAESTYTYNIWYVEREGDGWSTPRSIGRPINGRSDTSGPSVTIDGTMYFTLMNITTGHSEIYRSRLVNGVYQEPERLPDEVNSRFQNCDSYVAPDESYLLFVAFPTSGHQNNPGGLYVSFRNQDGTWSVARDLRPTIGSEEGSNVTISPDGGFLFLPRRDPAGVTGLDAYWVDADVVDALRAPAR